MSTDLTPYQQRLRTAAREFAYGPLRSSIAEREWLADPRARVDWALVEEADARGWRTMGVPAAHGGPERARVLDFCLLIEELAAGDMGFAVLVDQTIKISRIIATLATDGQQAEFWPGFVADPRAVLAITFTEPGHGSDNFTNADFRLDTEAVRDGDDWLITGEKRYISNGADAHAYVVFACTDRERRAREGSTAFLVDADTPGLEVVRIWDKISQRGNNNATLRFSGVRVADSRRLGPVDGGMRSAQAVLKESAVEAAATTLGSGRAAFEAAHAHARSRVQGGRPIIEHANVAIRLGWMAARLEAARELIWRAARELDADDGECDPMLGSMAKAFAARTAFDVATDACEIHGGAAIMIGESIVEKTLRDTLSFLHSDGTQDAHLLRVGQRLAELDSVLPVSPLPTELAPAQLT